VKATEPSEPRSFDQLAESLLAPSETEAPNPEPEIEETDDAPDEDQTEAEDSKEEVEDDAEAADGEEEPADEDDETGEEDASSEQPADRHTVKVDGEEVQVTLEELKRSYSGQSHIQKGMREAAATRQNAEAELQTLTQERQKLASLIQNIEKTGMQEPQAPALEMLDKDPLRYMREKGEYERQLQEFNAKRAAVRQQYQQHQQAESERRAQFLAEQERQLIEAIPDLADPQKADATKRALVKVGTDYGFSEEEVAGISDARAVKVLNDARKWRELEAQERAARAKAKPARPVVKPGTTKAQSTNSNMKKLKSRLKQTGSIDDAAALLLAPE